MRPRLAVVAPDLTKGARAAIATVVPFYLAASLERPELTWVALGGWLGSLADPGGTRRARALGMACFIAFGALAVALGGAAARVPVAAALVVAAFGFAASMARAIGGTAGNVGNTIAIVAAIAAAAPVAAPLAAGAWFAAGVLWAVALSSIVWPTWPHRPLRLALARVFAALAAYADALTGATAGGAVLAADAGPDWSAIARSHQREVRAALEHARETMVALRARRSGVTPVGMNLRMLLGDAEQTFFQLIGLGDEAERLAAAPAAGAARADLASALAELGATFRGIETRLLTRRPGAPTPTAPIASNDPLARRLVAASRAALDVARDLDVVDPELAARAELGAPAPARPLRAEFVHAARSLRDALAARSPVFWHAVRVAAVGAVALVIGRATSATHASWVTVTALAVLQPHLGSTLVRTTERVVGTIFGGAIAVAMMMTITDPLVLALALAPMTIAAVVTRPRSYHLFVLFLTPVFVLVTDRWHPSIRTAGVRIADVALGGAIALAASAIAPSVERARLPEALAAVLDALARYVRLAFDALPAGAPRGALTAARREVGVALESAEASLERMLAEPRAFQHGVADAVVLLTYGRRLSGTLTSLDEACAAAPPRVNDPSGAANAAPLAPPPAMPLAIRDHVLAAIDAARTRVVAIRDGASALVSAPAAALAPLDPLPPPPPHLAGLVHFADLVAGVASHGDA